MKADQQPTEDSAPGLLVCTEQIRIEEHIRIRDLDDAQQRAVSPRAAVRALLVPQARSHTLDAGNTACYLLFTVSEVAQVSSPCRSIVHCTWHK